MFNRFLVSSTGTSESFFITQLSLGNHFHRHSVRGDVYVNLGGHDAPATGECPCVGAQWTGGTPEGV